MRCNLYVQYYGATIWAGSFGSREAAETFYRLNKEAFKQKDGTYGKPVYVETGKGRNK